MVAALRARSARRKTAMYRFEDFCALVPDGQKGDLIDGVIYMASPENLDAASLLTWLCALLTYYIEAAHLRGEVFLSRVAFRIDDHNSPEPDLAYVRARRFHLKRRGFFAGAPDVAVEIVSPDSIERDYEKKLLLYEKARVPEYWIIDEIEQKVIVYVLGKDGRYREVPPVDGKHRSRVISGFWFMSDWLWQEPKPKLSRTLKKILSDGGNK